MVDNIPEKGAALQRDMETYAIIPYLPGGFISVEDLKKMVNIAEKYHAKTFKITPEQRVAIIGLPGDDIDQIWDELDMKPGGFTGKVVRSAKFCPGTIHCKKGEQDTIKMGMAIDEKFMGMSLPNKAKIGVSGCPNSCAMSAVRDIGLIGTKKGWNVMVGGNSGRKPMIGRKIAKNLSNDDAIELIDNIFNYYGKLDTKRRLGFYIEKIGFENFKKDLQIG
ncbi:MAG: NAD(P)/FAD-dependent oxidoreductase [Methanobacteriales archaeon HGW-Methanobacteriales-1]|jgi:NAD(P)H-nitrite reductase large subunit|nr:MAG: NAD(P)/FAD-dependent oxidoreductase [Methanobacteriales archaeon HGW-Methanobacteriales-1]